MVLPLAVRVSSCSVPAQLPLPARLLQFAIAGFVNLLLPAGQHVGVQRPARVAELDELGALLERQPGVAVEIAAREMPRRVARVAALQLRLWNELPSAQWASVRRRSMMWWVGFCWQ